VVRPALYAIPLGYLTFQESVTEILTKDAGK